MKRVTTRARSARGTIPRRAKVPVVRAATQMKGYPAFAMGNAV
jgi:hypothetical protein